jgi:hypothetical protein
MRATVLVLLALLHARDAGDSPRALRSKDPLDRVAAVEALARDTGGSAGRWLLLALRDPDPEVQLEAARALELRPDPRAVGPLVDLALHSPYRTVRLRAAAALRGVPKVERQMEKRARGRRAERAREALAVLRGEPVAAGEPVSWELRDLPGTVAERRGWAVDAGLTWAELRAVRDAHFWANRRATVAAVRAVLAERGDPER